jgi:hypothetical protein
MLHYRFYTILSFLSLVLLSACEKEETKDVSTVLRVPVLDLNGDEFISVAVGASYTDAGASYVGEDGQTTTLQPASNNVNTAAPGLYQVTFTQKSASGIFESEARRIVAVTYQENPTDYSGTYLRPATGVSATVTRVAPGLYQVENPGGAAGHGAVTVYFIETALNPGGAAGHGAVTVYFIETALNKFEGPNQHEDIGGVGDIEIVDIAFTPTGASWRIINNAFYGTGTRTFVKQ